MNTNKLETVNKLNEVFKIESIESIIKNNSTTKLEKYEPLIININEIDCKKTLSNKQEFTFLSNCSKQHTPLYSSSFTPTTDIKQYCESDSIVFKPFPARFYKKKNKLSNHFK